jgi:hypothetical protein
MIAGAELAGGRAGEMVAADRRAAAAPATADEPAQRDRQGLDQHPAARRCSR